MTRALGWLLLLVAGVLSLPLAASLLDDQGFENWIVPAQLGAMVLVGVVLGTALPGFVTGSRLRRVAVGAAYGVVAALVGVLAFFLLLSGFDGA